MPERNSADNLDCPGGSSYNAALDQEVFRQLTLQHLTLQHFCQRVLSRAAYRPYRVEAGHVQDLAFHFGNITDYHHAAAFAR